MNHSEIYDQVCSKSFNRIEGKIDRIVYYIEGNGTPGLKTRVDRLEQKSIMQSRFIWLLIAALITMFADKAYDRFTYHNEPIKLHTIEYEPLE